MEKNLFSKLGSLVTWCITIMITYKHKYKYSKIVLHSTLLMQWIYAQNFTQFCNYINIPKYMHE